ncbi:hypothetical protein CEXT_753381 [Caerostris extrusa]|uniref:Ycf15 n=1 Tax=Caerostris extrusa TaxID=172846 RepID=A0AAV4TIL2_CAEEX|nr:hypothetical protein CEXT_753381 [Caerostris extrusa]
MPNPFHVGGSSSSRDNGDRSSECVPPTFHILHLPGWDQFSIVNASENCLTSIMAKRLLCPMSFLLKGLPPSYSEDIVRKGRLFFFHSNARNYRLMMVQEMSWFNRSE